jgi:hypothetical protein
MSPHSQTPTPGPRQRQAIKRLVARSRFSPCDWLYIRGMCFLDPVLPKANSSQEFNSYIDNLPFHHVTSFCQSTSATLSENLKCHWATLARWNVLVPASIPNFAQYVGQELIEDQSLKGTIPSPPVQHALFSVRILDSILDACRPADDSQLVPEHLGTVSALFLNNTPPRFHTNKLSCLSSPGQGRSVLNLLENYLRDPSRADTPSPDRPSDVPGPIDTVMAQLVTTQIDHIHQSKKHAIIARLLEFSTVLRAWLVRPPPPQFGRC